MNSPTPDQIREARAAAGLTQTAAAALIGKSLKAWQNWECPVEFPSHRKMDAGLWELWQIKVAELA